MAARSSSCLLSSSAFFAAIRSSFCIRCWSFLSSSRRTASFRSSSSWISSAISFCDRKRIWPEIVIFFNSDGSVTWIKYPPARFRNTTASAALSIRIPNGINSPWHPQSSTSTFTSQNVSLNRFQRIPQIFSTFCRSNVTWNLPRSNSTAVSILFSSESPEPVS